ncbi:Crp/Fnr family transcriptional regulator [Litorimonas sp. RW-G-Af-16]|uniref:Crp/Fnr family transcriptional regulator n=1 Tax=Litorimonas sp. RW-G-Af-16 TaxID=3241168 RepID=UPI003AAC2378
MKRGEFVVEQDTQITDIWFVLKGQARAVIYSEDGQEIWMQSFGPGDLFGHSAVMTNSAVQFGIVAEKAMDLLIIPAKHFQERIQSDVGLSHRVATDLADRLNIMTLRMFELSTLSAPARIGMELLRLAQPIGIDEDRMIIRPAPVLSNMALKVQSTRETASRTVSRLLKMGLISRQPGAIVIEDSETMKDRLQDL